MTRRILESDRADRPELGVNARLFLCYSFGLGISWAMASLAVNLLLDAQGVSNSSIGYFNALIVAGTVIVALPLGWSSGRLGRRRALIVATATTPVALLLIILAPPGPVQMAGAFLLGAGETVYFTAGYPHMAENSPSEHRFRLYARSAFLYYAGMFCGYVACTGLSWALAQLRTGVDTITSLRVILALAGLVAAMTLIPLIRTGPPEHDVAAPATPSRVTRSPRVFTFAGVYVCAGLGVGALTPFVQLFLTQRYSLSVAAVGGVLAVAQLATAMATLLSHRLVGLFTAPGALLLTQLLVIPFTAGAAYASLLPIVVLCLVCRGMLSDMQEPMLNGHVMARIVVSQRSAAATVNQAVWLVGLMIGSAGSGVLQEHWGWEAAFSVSVLSSLVLGGIFARSVIGNQRSGVAEAAEA